MREVVKKRKMAMGIRGGDMKLIRGDIVNYITDNYSMLGHIS